MSIHRKKNGIPDRWLDYSAVGKRLHGTRFIAFKVPLKQALNRRLEAADVFGHWELLDALRRQNQELGLIIDLTFTSRYYKLQDVPQSLLFVKIFTAGHEVPNDETILSFKRSVRKFLRDNDDNDKLVGVHCTHGLNRTGYLICRYLIDVDGMEPDDAVQLFNSSRGHDIERQNYLDDLQRGPKRSNDGMEDLDQEPQRGQALHPPCLTSPDSQDEGRSHFNDTWNHRSFPPRASVHRPHHRLPPSPYRWTPHQDSDWSRTHRPENPRSRYEPPENPRSRYEPPENPRSRYEPPENPRSRYDPPENPRSRYEPPENLRSRYGPPDSDWSRLPPPVLPRFSPRWDHESGEPEEFWEPKMRHRTLNRHRPNGYD